MKKLLIVVLSASIMGCTNSHQKTNKITVKEQQTTLFCHVVDLSRSTNQLSAYNDSTIARDIYYALASQGGGTVKVFYISSNSLLEEIITIPVVAIDTESTVVIRNNYLKSKVIKANKEAKDNFNRQAEGNIENYIAAVSKPHDQEYTDVSNALSLTATTLRESNFRNHTKIVALFSDLIHCPKDKKGNKLQPVQFNATVLCVRPALSHEQLNKLFSQNVHVLTSSSDIILSITQINQSN